MQMHHVRRGAGKPCSSSPVLPLLIGNPVTRTLLFSQFSAHPWALPPKLVLRELRGYATAPSFDAALDALINGPLQQGAPAGSTPGLLVGA